MIKFSYFGFKKYSRNFILESSETSLHQGRLGWRWTAALPRLVGSLKPSFLEHEFFSSFFSGCLVLPPPQRRVGETAADGRSCLLEGPPWMGRFFSTKVSLQELIFAFFLSVALTSFQLYTLPQSLKGWDLLAWVTKPSVIFLSDNKFNFTNFTLE